MAANPYGPVTTTDSTQITDDDWELHLPPIKYKRYPGTDRLKSFCFELHQHKKNVAIAISGICIIILISMAITLAVGHYPEQLSNDVQTEGQSTDQGLVLYPVPPDNTYVISFAPNDFSKATPHPIKQSLDKVLNNYSTVAQLNENVFTDCNSTYNPTNKTCRVSRNLFGDTCSSHRNYGYQGGQPCVFIQLNLPNGVTIRPIMKESTLWEAAQEFIQEPQDTSYVPFTCDGTTSEDRETLLSVEGYGPNGERIMYFPEHGIQSYIYRERNASLPFLKPAIMVQFTSLVSRRTVYITCIAWGQLYDLQNRMIHHKLLSTNFALFVNHE